MAKAGDQYEMRTGNIWNFANRDDVATVRRLLSEGVPADLTNKVGWTPLHAAAAGGAERVLTLLCQRGVEVDPRCHAGRTERLLRFYAFQSRLQGQKRQKEQHD